MSPQTYYAGYCRSSTAHQFSFDVQRAAIEQHLTRIGGEVAAWYSEVRLASPSLRALPRAQPELIKALAFAKQNRATLIVSRLDRLARSVAILSAILEDGARIAVADLPNAGPFVLQICAAAAEEYRRQTSRRCSAGIAAAIAKGVDRRGHAKRGGAGNRAAIEAHAARHCSIIEEIRGGRNLSAGDVAEELNRRDLTTYRKHRWDAGKVLVVWRWHHRKWHTRRFQGRPSATAANETRVALSRAMQMRPLIDSYRRAGASTARQFMDCLNRDRVPMPSGLPWSEERTRVLLRRVRRGSAT
jgi:DNA invertase Pin-like site-specific DNA recombinase